MIARLVALCLTVAAPATAQVIEIGDDGVATVFAEPMVFTAGSAAPIIAKPAAPDAATAGISNDKPLAAAARAHGLDERLLAAVAWRESRGRQEAVSRKGALGVMQLMPATAAELGVDPHDREQNIRGGATYLKRQIDRFGSVALGLAAYNAGPGAVIRHGGIPPFAETRAYVRAILDRWQPSAVSLINPLLIEMP